RPGLTSAALMVSARPIPSNPCSRNSVAATSRMRSRVSADFSRLTLIGPLHHMPLDSLYDDRHLWPQVDVVYHLNSLRSRADTRAGPMRYGLLRHHTMPPRHTLRVSGTALV